MQTTMRLLGEIKEDVIRLRRERNEAVAEAKALEHELSGLNAASADALECLWEDIVLSRKPEYGDWEYPGEAYRHIMLEIEEMISEAK